MKIFELEKLNKSYIVIFFFFIYILILVVIISYILSNRIYFYEKYYKMIDHLTLQYS